MNLPAVIAQTVIPPTVIASPYDAIFSETSYKLHSVKEDFHGRVVKYLIKDTTRESVTSAAKAIVRLLNDNKDLCPLFPLENLETQIERKKYLIINVKAVCLAEECEAPDAFLRYADHYFSQALLRDPVTCSQHHHLEKEYAEFWIKKNGDVCPFSGDLHPIGNGRINTALQREIFSAKKDIQEVAKRSQENRETIERFEALQKRMEENQKKIDETKVEIAGQKKDLEKGQIELEEKKRKFEADQRRFALEREEFERRQQQFQANEERLILELNKSKIDLRAEKKNCLINFGVAGEVMAKDISELFHIKYENALVILRVGKSIPVVSVAVGVTAAVYRCHSKEIPPESNFASFMQVFREIVSGIFGSVPGLGIAPSVLIDRDIRICDSKEKERGGNPLHESELLLHSHRE